MAIHCRARVAALAANHVGTFHRQGVGGIVLGDRKDCVRRSALFPQPLVRHGGAQGTGRE